MRKLVLIICLLWPGFSFATLLVNEPFSYADGNVVGAPGSSWISDGSAGPVTVVSNQLKLILGNSEDVHLGLSGGPYNTANGVTSLYASMILNFTALPHANGGGSSGNYFAHFGVSGSSGFRCRLFASQTNAATGNYRLSIASTNLNFGTNGLGQYPMDLLLNTAYTVVLRLNLNTGNSTLWINPATELSASVSSSADPGTTAGISAFAFRQPGSSAPGTVLMDNLKIGTTFGDVAGANTAPVIGAVGNQITPAGIALGPIPFDVSDAETPATNLLVTATSSNPALVANTGIVISGNAGNRSLTITPLAGQQGSTTITLKVTDTDNNMTSTGFILTVGAPTISTIADQNWPEGGILPPLPFTVNDRENDPLTVTGTSSNPALVPNTTNNINLAGNGTNRTINLTPVTGQSGITTITLSVTDGSNTNGTSFILAINPQFGLIFSDSFSYPDGPLLGAANSPWAHHSPTGTNNLGELSVSGAAAQLNQALNEDLNATLTNSPFAPSNAVILYASMTLRLASLPAKSGEFFIHYKDAGSTFRGKIFVQTTNAAPGSYRISAANAGSTPVTEITQDLSLNTTYTIVFRYNTAFATTTLWLNPSGESDPSVTATDTTTPSTIAAIALRQNSGIGVLQVDDLKVGTSFNDVAGIRPTLKVTKFSANTVQISWLGTFTNFSVQSSTTLTNWQSAGTASLLNGQNTLVVTNSGGRLFLRLKQ